MADDRPQTKFRKHINTKAKKKKKYTDNISRREGQPRIYQPQLLISSESHLKPFTTIINNQSRKEENSQLSQLMHA